MFFILIHGLKIFVFAAFFFYLGAVKTEQPEAKWSQVVQIAISDVFAVCDNFEFCRNLDNTAIEKGTEK